MRNLIIFAHNKIDLRNSIDFGQLTAKNQNMNMFRFRKDEASLKVQFLGQKIHILTITPMVYETCEKPFLLSMLLYEKSLDYCYWFQKRTPSVSKLIPLDIFVKINPLQE